MSHIKDNTQLEYDEKTFDRTGGEHHELAGLPNTENVAEPKAHTTHAVSRYATLSLVQTLKTFRLPALYAVLAAFNAANDGYCYSIPGNVIAMEGFIDQFGIEFEGSKALKSTDLSNWGVEYTVGYIVILLFGTPLNDKLGRKWCILLLQLAMLISTVMSLVAKTAGVWGGAKIFQGLSVGLAQATVQSYVSEVAPTNARGFLLGVYQLFFALGQLTAAIATYIVNNMTADKWRHAIYSEFVMAGIALVCWVFLPESPRWCAQSGRSEKGKRILARMHKNIPDYDLEGEWSIIELEVAEGRALVEASSKFSYLALFKGVNRRRLLISFGPFAWQQWSGVPVIFGYTSYFFQLAGLKNPFNGTLAVFFILLGGVLCAMWSMEWYGRRPGLIVGGSVLTICLLIVGGVATMTQTAKTGAIIIAFACIWVFTYALSLAPIGYAVLAETSTVVLRSKTTSVAAGMTGLLNLVVNYCTPLMLSPTGANWGVMGTSFFYAGTCFIGLVLVFFFIPETKGRSFVELDELFERRISARKFKQTQTAAQGATVPSTA